MLQSQVNTDIDSIDLSNLVDIQDIQVNMKLPPKDRLKNYIDQIKNPYCFKFGKMVVQMRFSQTEATLEDRLIDYVNTK